MGESLHHWQIPSGEDRYVFTQETDDLDSSLFDQGSFKNQIPFFDSLFSVPHSSKSQFPAGPIFPEASCYLV